MTEVKHRLPGLLQRLWRFIPILNWLPKYDRGWLTFDIIAGLTLWGLVVPEGMAYAGIAGLPPQAGLYTLMASLLVYALFGSSRHLAVGATSASAALLAGTVIPWAPPLRYGHLPVLCRTLVMVTGLVFLVAGLARIGFITQFLSKPVMDGFITGLAVFVTVGQLNKFFGVPKGKGIPLKNFSRHPGAARGQLGHFRGGGNRPGAAVSAAALEQEDTGRAGGALWLYCPQHSAQLERQLWR